MGITGRFLAQVGLPRNLFGGMETILYGREEAAIEGCRRILRYNQSEVSVDAGAFSVSVFGQELAIARYHTGTIVVRGKIETVSFSEPGKRGKPR